MGVEGATEVEADRRADAGDDDKPRLKGHLPCLTGARVMVLQPARHGALLDCVAM